MAVRSSTVRRQSFLQRVKRFFLGEAQDSGVERNRPLAFERLDDRCLLAADFGAVIGKVYNDATNTGYDPSKDVVGAQVQLYRDDGDLAFDSGDTLVSTVSTGSGGAYRFDGLLAGNYFVRVPSQSVGAANLQTQTSAALSITAEMAAGTGRTMIDDFNTTSAQIIDGTPPGNGPTTSVTTGIAASATIGQARKLSADMSRADTDLDAAALQVRGGRLDETLSAEAAGKFRVVWDGGSGGASTIDHNGLGGVNLRAGGANAIQLRLVGLDHDATVTLRVYSLDSSTYTEWTQTLSSFQATGGAFRSHYFRFDGTGAEAPTARGGAGANFNSVGAIELTIDADTLGTDARFDFLNVVAPSELQQNFDNVVKADLSVTKTVDVARPNEGDEIRFDITVRNAATLPDGKTGAAASNVRMTDVLPAGLTLKNVINVDGVGSFNSSTGVWTVGSLAAGASATLTIVATVDRCDPMINTATVSTDGAFDVNTANNTASVEVKPMMVDLGLTKTVDKANPGKDENVTFTIRLSNAAGMDSATGVSVLDQLPSGLQFVSADTQGHGTYNSTTGVWTVGSIAGGATYTMTIVAKPTGTGTLTNTAEIASVDQCDDNTANDKATASVASKVVDLTVVKTVDDNTYDRNQDLNFTIKVKNNGPDGATGVVATDVLPAGLTYVTHATATGSFNSTTGVWTIGSLASGQEVTLNLAAKAVGTTAMTNKVVVSTPNERESDLTNNESSVVVTPNSVDIKVEKSVDKPTIKVDETAVFLITITNVSSINATSVKINDLIPSGVVISGAPTASKGTYNSTTGVWDIGALSANQSVTLSVTVKGVAPTAVTNTATLGTLDQLDSDPTNNTASAQLTVLPKPRPQGNPNGPSKRDALMGTQ